MTARPHAADAASVRVLLADAIDYAGLFPPAQLDMPGAVAEYAAYLLSTDRWALSRFVVPASRLDELGAVARSAVDPHARSLGSDRVWPLSAVFGADVAAEVDRVHEFHATYGTAPDGWFAEVRGVELRASTPDEVDAALRVVPSELERFVEIPLRGDVRALVRAIRTAGGFAKVRTGGTAADAFPSSDELIRFLSACVDENVPFKATAGLHHPVRGDYPLTYAPDSPRGTMYGFLNVMIAAAFLRAGAGESVAREVLEERTPEAFRFDGGGVSWRGRRLSTKQLASSRDLATRSFGSCSFREPIDDLTALRML
jgi:hypothetical protein